MVLRIKVLLLVIAALFSTGCGGDGQTRNGGDDAPSKAMEGRAVKGVLQNAVVTAYAYDVERKPTRFIASTLTDSDGYFAFDQLPDELLLLVVEAAGDGSSTMLCDASDGCGEGFDFGSVVPMAADFRLLSLVPQGVSPDSVAVTPLTHLAALWAAQFPLGVTDQTAALAISQVAAVFGLPADFALRIPVDVTDAEELATALQDDQKHAFLSAGFAQLTGAGDLQVVLAEYVQAFVDNGGQLPVSSGDGNLEELALAAHAVASRFIDGESNIDQLLAGLQELYTRWSGPITIVGGVADYDAESFARAMGPLDDLDQYLRQAGIDETGTFLASQAHQLDWLYTQHTLDLAEVSLVSALTVIQAAIMTDLMLSQFPAGYPLPATWPMEVQGMPELSAVLTISTRRLVITGVHNGQTVDITVDLAPLLAGLGSGELHYEAVASVSNTEITGELGGSLVVDLYETDFDPLLAVLASAVSGGELAPEVLEEVVLELLADLHVRARIEGSAAIYLTENQAFGFHGALDAWAEINVPVLASGAEGPLLSVHIESGELVSPDGDRLFSLDGVPALHVDVGDSATLAANFGFEAFGLPLFEVEADGELTGLGDLVGQLLGGLSENGGELSDVLAIVSALDLSVLNINGAGAIQGDGKRWQFVLDGARLDATAANDTDVALSFFLTGLNGGYIYSGDELVATVAFNWSRIGATIHFIDGQSRSYFAGEITDILPQEVIDAIFGALISIGG